MIETNHDEALLQDSLDRGVITQGEFNRISNNHLSVEKAAAFLQETDLSRVKEIHLLHISKRNGDAGTYKQTIQAATGKPVYIAARE